MKTLEQKFVELKKRANLGAKICGVLLILFLVSSTVNIILALQLHNKVVSETFEKTLLSTGAIEKVDSTTFVLLSDDDLDSFDLTPIPETLK